MGKKRQRDCEAEMSGTVIPLAFPCGLQVLVMTVQMGTTEVKGIGGQGGRGRNEAEILGTGMPTVSPYGGRDNGWVGKLRQRDCEAEMSRTGIPAVSSCGLKVLILTAQMGTTEVKTIGGWESRGRETAKQKCRELVYQRFPPVVFKCWY